MQNNRQRQGRWHHEMDVARWTRDGIHGLGRLFLMENTGHRSHVIKNKQKFTCKSSLSFALTEVNKQVKTCLVPKEREFRFNHKENN